MKRSLLLLLAATACGPPHALPVEDVVRDVRGHLGKEIAIRAKLRSGARCRQGEDGEWKTYCKDCVYCRGPLVVDLGQAVRTTTSGDQVFDWPMILGGTWEFKDIRCKGPLNQVECYPFVEGKTYIIEGSLENQKPPKFLVKKFWPGD